MAIRHLNPLNWTVPIVDASGRPTEEFMRKWAQQTQINGAIFDTSTLPAHTVVLGTGKQASLGFSPLGTGGQILVGQTGADPAFKSVSQDGALTAAGALTVTGLQTHAVSATNPTNGQVLTWNGSAWAPVTPFIGAQYASVVFDGSDVYFANAISLADPELVFAGGIPTYTKNPAIPYSILSGTPSIPVGANPSATAKDTAVNGSAVTFMRSDAAPAVQKASSSQFGIVKVDGKSIIATSGVIGFGSLYWRMHLNGAQQSFTSGTNVTIAMDTVDFDPQSWCDVSVHKGRVTPTVAGYYRVTVSVQILGTTGPAISAVLAAAKVAKNGSQVSVAGIQAQVASLANPAFTGLVSDIVYCNGSTDYLEPWASSSSTSPLINNDGSVTFMSGEYVGP